MYLCFVYETLSSPLPLFLRLCDKFAYLPSCTLLPANSSQGHQHEVIVCKLLHVSGPLACVNGWWVYVRRLHGGCRGNTREEKAMRKIFRQTATTATSWRCQRADTSSHANMCFHYLSTRINPHHSRECKAGLSHAAFYFIALEAATSWPLFGCQLKLHLTCSNQFNPSLFTHCIWSWSKRRSSRHLTATPPLSFHSLLVHRWFVNREMWDEMWCDDTRIALDDHWPMWRSWQLSSSWR